MPPCQWYCVVKTPVNVVKRMYKYDCVTATYKDILRHIVDCVSNFAGRIIESLSSSRGGRLYVYVECSSWVPWRRLVLRSRIALPSVSFIVIRDMMKNAAACTV
jgi:hypothetical protein